LQGALEGPCTQATEIRAFRKSIHSKSNTSFFSRARVLLLQLGSVAPVNFQPRALIPALRITSATEPHYCLVQAPIICSADKRLPFMLLFMQISPDFAED